MMSSNAPTEATEATSKPMAHALKVQPKALKASPSKNALDPAMVAPGKTATKRNTRSATKAVVGPTPKKAALPSLSSPEPKTPKSVSQRPPKIKMVRDSFTFPEAEHKRLVEMKKRLIALGAEVKKGQLVRAGLELLATLDNQKLVNAVAGVDKLKSGRPKK